MNTDEDKIPGGICVHPCSSVGGIPVSLADATPADLDLLTGYMRGLRSDDPFPAAAADVETAGRAAMAELLGNSALGRVWLIRADDRPVGYIALTFVHSLEFGGRCGFLDEVYVEPASRRKGVGRSALNLALGTAGQLGLRAVLLEVSPENAAACEFYRSAGFFERKYRLMAKCPPAGSAATID